MLFKIIRIPTGDSVILFYVRRQFYFRAMHLTQVIAMLCGFAAQNPQYVRAKSHYLSEMHRPILFYDTEPMGESGALLNAVKASKKHLLFYWPFSGIVCALLVKNASGDPR